MNSTKNNYRIATLQDRHGRVHEVTEFPYVIGRNSDADLSLSSSSISRRHAQIELIDGRYRLIDLGSTNGTWVNDYKINQVMLDSQDSVRFGDETLTFVIMHPAHARVVASARLDDALMVKRQSASSLSLDEDFSAEIGTEDRNWFIWIVALVILFAMLASAYLIFEIRSGDISETNEVSRASDQELAALATIKQPVKSVVDDQLVIQQSLNEFKQSVPADMVVTPPPIEQIEKVSSAPQNQNQVQSRLQEILEEAGSPDFQRDLKNEQATSSDSQSNTNNSQDNSSAQLKDWPELPSGAAQETANSESSKRAVESKVAAPRKAITTQKKSVSNIVPSIAKVERTTDKNNKKITSDTNDPVKLYFNGNAPKAIKILEQKIADNDDMNIKADLIMQRQSLQVLYQQYQMGQEALANGEKNKAFQQWISFLDKEKAFMVSLKQPSSAERSRYAREIAKKVGEEYFSRAERAKAERKFADAYRYWMLAAKFEDRPEAFARANTVEQHAQQLYQQAITLETKNPEEALRLWQEILTILPSDHNLYTKANAKLTWGQRQDEGSMSVSN